MTVRELRTRIDAAEFDEWYAFATCIQPIGGRRVDFAAANVCQTIANVHRTKGKAYKIRDFLPDWDKAVKVVRQSADQMAAIAKAITVALGGKVQARGDNRQPGA